MDGDGGRERKKNVAHTVPTMCQRQSGVTVMRGQMIADRRRRRH